jgi:hypothetical protein
MLDDKLKAYVEAAGNSSRRCRLTAMIIITASILALMAWWNSLPSSWSNQRVRVIDDSLAWWPLADTNKPMLISPDDSERFFYRFVTAQKFVARKFDIPEDNLKTSVVNSNRLGQIKSILGGMQGDWHRLQAENVMTIHVSVFGVSLDVNDLGLFAGFTFLILLTIMHFTLCRELENLKYVFQAAEESKTDGDKIDLFACYELLAMQQVLTIPHSKQRLAAWHLRWIPNVFLLFPFAIEFLILGNDWHTRGIGNAISDVKTLLLFVFGFTFFVLTGLITGFCLYKRHEINKEWDAEFARLSND